MPLRTYLPLSAAALCLGLASCSKSGSKPNTTPNDSTTTTTATMNIDCTLPLAGSQIELVISEPGGKILLDTLSNNAGPMVAALKTNDTLLDVTLVTPPTGRAIMYATTYTSINPSRLTSLTINSYQPAFTSGTSANYAIDYYNIPPAFTAWSFNLGGGIFFSYFYSGGPDSYGSSNPYARWIQYIYQSDPGNYTFLLLPQIGLYKLHKQQQPLDSVDCTNMDTAATLIFNRQFPFTAITGASTLYAIPDTNDLTKIISFSNPTGSIGQGFDFEYAPIPVEKYNMNYLATNDNNDVLNYYTYTDTLPKTLPLFQSSDYSISNAQADDFSVTFPGSRPSYYQLTYSNTELYYTVWVSPDSAAPHPITTLTIQKCKLLQNVNLQYLPLTAFTMVNFNGFDYAGYFQYITNPAAIKAKPIPHLSSITKKY